MAYRPGGVYDVPLFVDGASGLQESDVDGVLAENGGTGKDGSDGNPAQWNADVYFIPHETDAAVYARASSFSSRGLLSGNMPSLAGFPIPHLLLAFLEFSIFEFPPKRTR